MFDPNETYVMYYNEKKMDTRKWKRMFKLIKIHHRITPREREGLGQRQSVMSKPCILPVPLQITKRSPVARSTSIIILQVDIRMGFNKAACYL